MSYSAYDLKQFYQRRAGRLVRRMVSSHIHQFWPDTKGKRLLGYGYALPYLRPFQDKAERVCAAMSARNGVHFWPENAKGLVAMTAEGELPFETESIDGILAIHGLEFCEMPEALCREFWRVLKSDGRLLLVIPSRIGLWARVDWTPFGHGMPYTMGQINHYLQDSLFTIERKDRALFMPPFRSFLALRTAYTFESFGKYIFPGLAGLHVIEASKQIYSGVLRHERERVRGRRIIVSDPVSA